MKSKISLNKFIKLLKNDFPNLKIKQDEYFKQHTTFKIGGKIFALIEIDKINLLLKLLKYINFYKIRYFILGAGSNLLVNDKKMNFIVLKIKLNKIEKRNNEIICSSGVNIFKLNQFAIKNNLGGLEWSFGIPGTVGGAIKMNAGCFGGQISDVVKTVYYTDGYKIHKKSNRNLEFSYRKSFFSDKNFVILKVVFVLYNKNMEEIKQNCFENLKKRRLSQPYNYPSAGSIFKRYNNFPIPILIEKCNLKGLTFCGAQISNKHCGFIVNINKAKFNHVYKLILKIKNTIYKKFGIILEEEIIIIKN